MSSQHNDGSTADIRTADVRKISGPARPGLYTGVVASYDPDSGLGVAESADRRWLFHCTSIAGGSRSIDEGVMITFAVRAGGPGRFEAFEVTELR